MLNVLMGKPEDKEAHLTKLAASLV